jgi:hypothetical protein
MAIRKEIREDESLDRPAMDVPRIDQPQQRPPTESEKTEIVLQTQSLADAAAIGAALGAAVLFLLIAVAMILQNWR